MSGKLTKTVIGSYPVSFDHFGLVAIREAVMDQIKAGVDMVSDGQTRTDMISYFAKMIDGMSPGKDKAKIKDRIEGSSPGVLVRDMKVAKGFLESGATVKGIITGPITLAFSSEIVTDIYEGYRDKKLYADLTKQLLEIAKALEAEGAAWIQIDEPYISVGAPMDIAKESIETITSGLKAPVALHVCGDVTNVFDQLLEFGGVALLSHAFAGSPMNLKILDRKKIENAGKKIGLGCVDTTKTKVEDPSEVTALIKKAAGKIGKENIVVHPDCGLRTLPRDAARSKMEAMCRGADAVD
jgi:5-methyltetrahydropteroyltriglutamate--homocysteine methyltransferase